MRLFRLLSPLVLLGALPCIAQSAAHTHAATAAVASNTNPDRPVPAALKPYLGCKLPNGPEMLQHTLLPQAPMTRPVQTLTGPRVVKMDDGVFTAWGYPGMAPLANVKVELLPASTYRTEKADLIGEFDAINAKGEDTQRNYALKPTLNGFEIYGFDRTALDGNVLGIYLFFDNAHHVATTAYFLNAPQGQRRFNDVAQYSTERANFLDSYTACVRKQLGGVPAAPVAHKAPAHRR